MRERMLWCVCVGKHSFSDLCVYVCVSLVGGVFLFC